jgi:SAM-dependent MidA family methyltransferase
VDVVVHRQNEFRLMRVACHGDSFCWIEAETVDDSMRAYLAEYASEAPNGALVEVNLDAMTWVARIGELLESGYLLAIDYGYSSKELLRFPNGTLMSYRKHRAMEDVLSDPGDRDLTAHVNFSALAAGAARNGFEMVRMETMGRMILRAGEPDEFACVFDGVDDRERSRRMLQLKSLMFGMGESFLALLLRKCPRTK